jgi:predicted RNase H-like nuclease (RuvC/YqgF family)
VRLTDEKIADVKEYLARSMKVTASSLIPQLSKYGLDLIDAIESLQQENEQLRAKLEDWKHEVQCHMDEVVARDKEIEKLRGRLVELPNVRFCPNCGAKMEVEP